MAKRERTYRAYGTKSMVTGPGTKLKSTTMCVSSTSSTSSLSPMSSSSRLQQRSLPSVIGGRSFELQHDSLIMVRMSNAVNVDSNRHSNALVGCANGSLQFL